MKFNSTSDLPPAIMTLCGAKLADPGPEVERDRCNYRSKASGQAPHLDAGRAATFTLCITSAVELRTRLTFGYETGEGRSETESSLERRRRSVQELRGISRRVTKRKAG